MKRGAPTARAELDEGHEAVWRRYRANVARHLIGVARDLQARVLESLRDDHGYEGLRPSLGPFLSLVWLEGRSIGAIAAQLAISKQACGQLANLAERSGYLERVLDPSQRRGKRVLLTPLGRALVEDGVRIIRERDSDYAALVGSARYRGFTESAAALFAGLGIPSHADLALKAAGTRSMGVLPLLALEVQERLMEASLARGHAGLKISHGQILPLLGPEGMRLRDLADVHRVSRQAIGATSRDLERLGYVRRAPDPKDRRGVLIVLTVRGERLIRDSVDSLAGLEDSFVEILGDRSLREFKEVAAELFHALHLEEEIFGGGAPGRALLHAVEAARVSDGAADLREIARTLERSLGHRDAVALGRILASGKGRQSE
jgi:DNA-binding MarR family transcriptional regulator